MKVSNKLSIFWILAAMLLTISVSAFAEADPKLWPVMKEAFFEKRPMQEVDFIKIDAPKRAESGAQVPVTYSIDANAAKTAGVKIVKLYSFVDANPIPLTATYHLTDALGDFNLSTRIRFETDAFVRLVGEDANGKLYLASRPIRAAGGCGGIVSNDEAAVRAAAGKIRMKVPAPETFGVATTAKVNIKHVMRTGLQRDLESQGFLPAFYINKASFTYNGKPVMTVDVNVGTAEDPYFKFNFIPEAPGQFELVATDNEGKTFTQSVDVKG
ncbi:MAG: quinoprotein dehydrogenase-associated SoxYZ-like carrier [Methylophilaceae bacterium]